MNTRNLALLLLVLLGIAGVIVFGLSALDDWGRLPVAQARFQQVASSNAGLREVFVAHAKQDIHRTNLFAEGVWTLLSGVIAAIGVHGLCVRRADGGQQ